MKLENGVFGCLIQRRNRFVAEVMLADGRVVEAHCPNTGSMAGCKTPGSRVVLSPATTPGRKLAWTWELVEADGVWVGLHTGRSNGLVEDAWRAGYLPPLAAYEQCRREVKYGENSRIDLLLTGADLPPCYLEVKNVTAAVSGGRGYFPDAVTARGSKHLREMMAQVALGHRAALVFCVQRPDVREVRPADTIDPVYGQTLRAAVKAGVEVYALGARVSPDEIGLVGLLPVVLD